MHKRTKLSSLIMSQRIHKAKELDFQESLDTDAKQLF